MNELFGKLLGEYQKSLLKKGADINAFVQLLLISDYENAHKMLSVEHQDKITPDELQSFIMEDPVDENPKASNFQEEQKPYKEIAIKFANCLVNSEYQKAFDMLSVELQQEYTIESLSNNMGEMVSYFETPDTVWVDEEFVLQEGAIDEGCIYVPIVEEGNSEAVTLDIVYYNDEGKITELEWGRP
jgi:hypothetical protein